MALNIKPEVGNWYMNMTGQLIKVWALAYSKEQLAKVVIEYLNGEKRIISIGDWNHLDLEVHLNRAAHRRNGGHFHH